MFRANSDVINEVASQRWHLLWSVVVSSTGLRLTNQPICKNNYEALIKLDAS